MNFIIEFYKELETLDLIIFWGIIIVIILLLIFSMLLLNKNKKLKKIMDIQHNKENKGYEELPIKKEDNIEKNIQNENEVIKENIDENNINSIVLPQTQLNKEINQEEITNPIKTEKKFIAEEHVIEYNKDFTTQKNITKTNNDKEENINREQEKTNIENETEKNNKKILEFPTGPYQRNVLREMSLSQTSPIGLTIPNKKENYKKEIINDLESALNQKEDYKDLNLEKTKHQEISNQIKKDDIQIKDNSKKEINTSKQNEQKINETIKKELTNIENQSPRKTEIKEEQLNKNTTSEYNRYQENKYSSQIQNQDNVERISKQNETKNIDHQKIMKSNHENQNLYERTNGNYETQKNTESITKTQSHDEKTNDSTKHYDLNKDNEMTSKNKDNFYKISDSKNKKEIHEKNIDPQVKQLLNSVSIPIETKEIKKSSEKYLEEVSRKLSEAEIPDEIERTDYELEQEENAIISYKELMEKKDSIQTIDEEEAIISIEELMNRNNSKEEKITKENYQDKTDYKDDKLYNLTEDEANDDFLRELKQFRNDL